MSSLREGTSRQADIARADEELLAALGYKQEFQRAFSGLEVSYRAVSSARAREEILKLRFLDIRYCIQHYWSLALYCVSFSVVCLSVL